MAHAPNTAQGERNAAVTESCAPAGGGASAKRRRKTHMNSASTPIIAAMSRNEVSMLRKETARDSAALAAPLAASNIPPCNINRDPRYGPITVPRELNACDKVNRRCDRSGGPSAAARGL